MDFEKLSHMGANEFNHELFEIGNKWLNWYWGMATNKEKELCDLVSKYSQQYFSDFRFKHETIVAKYVSVNVSGCNTYDDANPLLQYFDEVVLSSYQYKVKNFDDKDIIGQVNYKEHSITLIPKAIDDEDFGKPHILHEIIHIYEEVIDCLPKYYHDILLISLYEDLKIKVADLQDRIVSHTHIIPGEQITSLGGEHDLLFFLKSIDLDLRCGYLLGTVCGYGRDEYDGDND